MKSILTLLTPAKKTPSFDSITAGLQSTIDQLEGLNSANTDKIAVIGDEIAALDAQIVAKQKVASDLSVESARAATTASKLRALIGG